jgi:hypothetical protein
MIASESGYHFRSTDSVMFLADHQMPKIDTCADKHIDNLLTTTTNKQANKTVLKTLSQQIQAKKRQTSHFQNLH